VEKENRLFENLRRGEEIICLFCIDFVRNDLIGQFWRNAQFVSRRFLPEYLIFEQPTNKWCGRTLPEAYSETVVLIGLHFGGCVGWELLENMRSMLNQHFDHFHCDSEIGVGADQR